MEKRGSRRKEVKPKTEDLFEEELDTKITDQEQDSIEETEEDEPLFEDTIEKKSPEFYSDEALTELDTSTYEALCLYNKHVRKNRLRTRKATIPFKYVYCEKGSMPEEDQEMVPFRKVRMTRTKNRGTPISLNIKDSKNWVHMKGIWDDGTELRIPEVMIDRINELAEPKYKQVKYPDGSSATVLDYMDNKYSVQIIMR